MSYVKGASKWLLAILMIGAGTMHFANPEFFVKIVPPALPSPLGVVYLSGFFELLLGVLLLVPKSSRLAAWGIIALLIAVFPANIYAYQHQELIPAPPLLHLLRLPLQGVLILWAYWHTRAETGWEAPRLARGLRHTPIAAAVANGHAGRSDHFAVRLISEAGEEVDGVFVLERGDTGGDCRLILRSPLGEFAGSEWNYFHALCQIRRQLEEAGWRPVCYGSGRNVYPSGMCCDMGQGLQAYRLKLGRHAILEDLVPIFDSGPDVLPVSVEEQERFREDWLQSLAGRTSP